LRASQTTRLGQEKPHEGKRHTPEQIIRKLRTAEQLLIKARPWPISAVLWKRQPRPATDSSSCAVG